MRVPAAVQVTLAAVTEAAALMEVAAAVVEGTEGILCQRSSRGRVTWIRRLSGAFAGPCVGPAAPGMEHAGFSSTMIALKGNRWKRRSTDADGNVVEYLWEIGDGAAATGSRATHTYAEPGRYLTTLAIRDNAGGEDFKSADHAVDISTYGFVGFLRPVAAQRPCAQSRRRRRHARLLRPLDHRGQQRPPPDIRSMPRPPGLGRAPGALR